MRPNRLVWRLFFPYVVAILIGVTVFGLFESNVFRQFYHNRFADELTANALASAPEFAPLLKSPPPETLRSQCSKLADLLSARVTVCLSSGEVVADSAEDPARMDNHADRPEIRDAMAGGPGRSVRRSNTLDEDLMYVAVPIRRDGAVVGVFRLAQPMPFLREGLRAVQWRIAMGGAVTVAMIAAVSYWISRRIAGALEIMRQGAQRFAQGKLAHRLATPDVIEFAALTDALNRMAEQLDQRLQELVRQKNEQAAVLGSMVEGVMAIAPDGKILNLNDACARLLEAEPEAIRGRLIHEVIRKPDLLAFVEEALVGGDLQRDIPLRGAEDRWLQTYAATLHDAGGRVFGVLLVLHDTTRLRHLENVRRDFVANVSHELRTPLTSVKGFLETLLDGALDDRENARRFLQISLRQIDRLSAIIDDLLALSRLEKNDESQPVELAIDALAPVLHAAVEVCAKNAADKSIRIDCRCPDDLLLPLDVPQLERAVVNLLDNAIKYSGSGSTVVLRADHEENEIVLRVEDQGCGIEPQHLPRIFERFYRVDKARSRELGGTGLGLSIVKHIALAHRGRVGVESTVGHGSVFWIRLPAE